MKINEAKALGVTIITENDYLALITKNQITIQDSDINQHQLSLFEQDLNTGK
jgi:hypothetical protein